MRSNKHWMRKRQKREKKVIERRRNCIIHGKIYFWHDWGFKPGVNCKYCIFVLYRPTLIAWKVLFQFQRFLIQRMLFGVFILWSVLLLYSCGNNIETIYSKFNGYIGSFCILKIENKMVNWWRGGRREHKRGIKKSVSLETWQL